jgi:ferrous iron transport protein B
VAVVRRETSSWRWPIAMVVLMNGMAWLASFAVYQGGRLLGMG